MANDRGRIQELADGMIAGDSRAMKAFFTFVRGAQNDIGPKGAKALAVIVRAIQLLLPSEARLAYVEGRSNIHKAKVSAPPAKKRPAKSAAKKKARRSKR